MKKTILITIFIGCLLASCSRKKSEPVPVTRLDLALRAEKLTDPSIERTAAQKWFEVIGAGELNDSTLAAYNTRRIEKFYAGVDSTWTQGRTDSLGEVIGDIYAKLGEMFPDMQLPRPIGVISPFNQSIIIADSLVFIGLNHYLGGEYPFYQYFPVWMRRDKNPARVGENLTEAIVRTNFPLPHEDDVLSEMLYEGAILEIMDRVIGEEALPWTEEQLDFLEENEKRIWDKMLSDRLVFSTDDAVHRSLFSPGVSTSIISQEVPARAGSFIGWKIVRSRLNNRDVDEKVMLSREWLTDLEALREARYQP
ncbi:MAG: hypothetical protein K2K55_02580 [Duncaniella sp.]|nr:hypothetical protein [Duncaniella sp.]